MWWYYCVEPSRTVLSCIKLRKQVVGYHGILHQVMLVLVEISLWLKEVILVPHKMSQLLPQLFYVLDCYWLIVIFTLTHHFFSTHNLPPGQLQPKLWYFMWF